MNLRNAIASDAYEPKEETSDAIPEYSPLRLKDTMTYLVNLKTTETAKGQRRVKSISPPPNTLFSLVFFSLLSLEPFPSLHLLCV